MMKAEIQEKETALQEKDAQLHEKDMQLQEKVLLLKQKDALIKAKVEELDKMQRYDFDATLQRILLEQKTRELILTQELLHQFQVCIHVYAME